MRVSHGPCGPLSRRYGSVGGLSPWSSGPLYVSHGFRTERYQNTFSLDTASQQWQDITPREGHIPFSRCLLGGAVTLGGRLAMFGGCGSGERELLPCVGCLSGVVEGTGCPTSLLCRCGLCRP
jgi:hypothetical protein